MVCRLSHSAGCNFGTILLLLACCLAARPAQAQPAASPGANNTVNATCDTAVTRSPWGVPNLLFGTPPGLLNAANTTYTNVTLCCGGTLDFEWSRPHGIFQLRQGTCPGSFPNNPAGGFKPLVAVTDSGSATLRFPNPGTYYITSHNADDCTRGMFFRITIPPGATGQCTNGTAGGGSGGNGSVSAMKAAGGH